LVILAMLQIKRGASTLASGCRFEMGCTRLNVERALAIDPYELDSAYLAFGDLFFEKAKSDASKLELAKQAYLEVLKHSPRNSVMTGFASYKLAHVSWNQEDLAQSLSYFKLTISFAEMNPTSPNAGPLATAARKDLIPVYALAGKPDAAYGFFKTLSA
jgi:tetratricopeptide (TPR) repeat protein